MPLPGIIGALLQGIMGGGALVAPAAAGAAAGTGAATAAGVGAATAPGVAAAVPAATSGLAAPAIPAMVAETGSGAIAPSLQVASPTADAAAAFDTANAMASEAAGAGAEAAGGVAPAPNTGTLNRPMIEEHAMGGNNSAPRPDSTGGGKDQVARDTGNTKYNTRGKGENTRAGKKDFKRGKSAPGEFRGRMDRSGDYPDTQYNPGSDTGTAGGPNKFYNDGSTSSRTVPENWDGINGPYKVPKTGFGRTMQRLGGGDPQAKNAEFATQRALKGDDHAMRMMEQKDQQKFDFEKMRENFSNQQQINQTEDRRQRRRDREQFGRTREAADTDYNRNAELKREELRANNFRAQTLENTRFLNDQQLNRERFKNELFTTTGVDDPKLAGPLIQNQFKAKAAVAERPYGVGGGLGFDPKNDMYVTSGDGMPGGPALQRIPRSPVRVSNSALDALNAPPAAAPQAAPAAPQPTIAPPKINPGAGPIQGANDPNNPVYHWLNTTPNPKAQGGTANLINRLMASPYLNSSAGPW